MDIEKFFPSARKKTGNEYAGPCPACGGVDRFLVWPDGRKGFRYLCRGCGVKGDAIQYMRDFEGMSYKEALFALGLEVRRNVKISFPARQRKVAPPRPCCTAEWRRAAFEFMTRAQAELERDAAIAALDERGLTLETAYKCNLGYVPFDLRYPRQYWGLENLPGPNGHAFVIPRGLVIASKDGGCFTNIEVRSRDWRQGVAWPPKFRAIPGGADVSFCTPLDENADIVFITESALDACLLWQLMDGSLLAISAKGASKGFDAETIDMARTMKTIIGVPDNDPAGWNAARKWAEIFPNIKFWAPLAKDPGEMHKQGMDIRAWVEAFFMREQAWEQ